QAAKRLLDYLSGEQKALALGLLLDDPTDWESVHSAARAVEALGEDARLAAPALVRALLKAVESKAVTRGLLTLGRSYVPALARALDSDDPRVRERIIGLLGDFGEQARAAAPALRRLLRDPSLDLYAAYHLWRIEPGAAETLTVLRAALAHD